MQAMNNATGSTSGRGHLFLMIAILGLLAADVGVRIWDKFNPNSPANLDSDFGRMLYLSNNFNNGIPLFIDETKGPPYVIVKEAAPVGSAKPTHTLFSKQPDCLNVIRHSDRRMLWIPIHSIARIEVLLE